VSVCLSVSVCVASASHVASVIGNDSRLFVDSIDFVPELLLATLHRDTSMRQLRDAVAVVRHQMIESEGQLQAMVHHHLDRFVICKDIVQSRLAD
jgi:hypothetical protein